jgi:hypothetical protein
MYTSLEILFLKAKESRAREGGRNRCSEFLRVGCSPVCVAIEREHTMLSHSNFYVQIYCVHHIYQLFSYTSGIYPNNS